MDLSLNQKPYPFHPRPFYGETLTSYIQRLAYANNISPYELWSKFNKNILSMKSSSTLDWAPGKLILVDRIAEVACLSSKDIYNMTFTTVLRKLGVSSNDTYTVRALTGLLEFNKKYCPLCIKEKPFYRLIWQVKEISICEKHSIKLLKECPKCKKPLPCLSDIAMIGNCGLCGSSLSEEIITERATEMENTNHLRLYQDWEFLLDPSNELISFSITGEVNVDLAMLKLFFDLGKPDNVIRKDLKRNSEEEWLFSQFIDKRAETTSNIFHLQRLLQTVRKADVTMEEFSKTTVPENFVRGLKNLIPSRMKLGELTCLAPWCSSYKKPGSIVQTSKKYISNLHRTDISSKYRRHSYCTQCGVQYGFNERGEFVERGYLIDLGWKKIVPSMQNNITVNQLSKMLNVDRTKVMKCVYYFSTRGMFPEEILLKYIPGEIAQQKIDKVKSLIEAGWPSVDIAKALRLKEKEMIFLIYHPQLYLTWLGRPRQIKKQNHLRKNVSLIEETISKLLVKGEVVSLKSVGKEIGVSEKVLKGWKVIDLIKECAQKQHEQIICQEKVELWNKTETVISKLSETGELKVGDVCKDLNILPTTLRSKDYTLYKYISERVKQHKKEQKSKREEELINKAKVLFDEYKARGELLSRYKIQIKLGLYSRTLDFYPLLNQALKEITKC